MVLTKSTDIRIAIRDVLKSENGRRIAISAFVGADVLKYVGNAKGLEVYCWPHPVATNPDGIRDLLNAGATVYFVDRLHMKLFWSQHGGHVIGSPNLSNNALGGHETRGLLEAASVESDSTGIAIDDVLALIHQRGATLVTPDVLAEFEREYKYLGIEAPPQNSKRRNESAPTFNAYLSLPVPVQWAYVPWTESVQADSNEIVAAKTQLELATQEMVTPSEKLISDSIVVSRSRVIHQWLLAYKVQRGKVTGFHWIFTHCIVNDRYNNANAIAIEISTLHVPRAPFDLNTDAFRQRFTNYLNSAKTRTFPEAQFDPSGFSAWERSGP